MIVAWAKVIIVEVVRNRQILDLLWGRTNKICWLAGYMCESKQTQWFLQVFGPAIRRWSCSLLKWESLWSKSYLWDILRFKYLADIWEKMLSKVDIPVWNSRERSELEICLGIVSIYLVSKTMNWIRTPREQVNWEREEKSSRTELWGIAPLRSGTWGRLKRNS